MSFKCVELYKETRVFGAQQIKIRIRNGEFDTQIVCIDKLHDTLTGVDTLIVFHQSFFDRTVERSCQLGVAHIVGRQFVFRLRLLEVGEADFIFLHGDRLPGEEPFVTFHLCRSRFVCRFRGGILQRDVSGVDSRDELSFFHFLSFDDRKLDDLSVDPESQLHIFHRFHDSREIFSDNRS